MSIYLDTSALAKLLVTETESAELREWLRARSNEPLVTSVIGIIELTRVAARVGAVEPSVRLSTRLAQMEVTAAVAAEAGRLPPPTVRTLAAIHVASAAQLGDLSALVTYDERMGAAALGMGLPVTSPGR